MDGLLAKKKCKNVVKPARILLAHAKKSFWEANKNVYCALLRLKKVFIGGALHVILAVRKIQNGCARRSENVSISCL